MSWGMFEFTDLLSGTINLQCTISLLCIYRLWLLMELLVQTHFTDNMLLAWNVSLVDEIPHGILYCIIWYMTVNCISPYDEETIVSWLPHPYANEKKFFMCVPLTFNIPEVHESNRCGCDQSEPRSHMEFWTELCVGHWLVRKRGHPKHCGKCGPTHMQTVWTLLVQHAICTGQWYLDFFASIWTSLIL